MLACLAHGVEMTSHCVCAVTTSHRRQCERHYDVMCLLGKTGDGRNTKAKMYEEIMKDKEKSEMLDFIYGQIPLGRQIYRQTQTDMQTIDETSFSFQV